MTEPDTDFGYERLSPAEKTRRVGRVFSSVAGDYDLMNDLMSGGAHRCWKRRLVRLCALKPRARVLDLAAGTGDVARLIHRRLGPEGRVTLCDINQDMLQTGRDRCIDRGIIDHIDYVRASAEALPFADNRFDCMTIAFGLRNLTDKQAALGAMRAKLKYGAQLLILEFSKVVLPLLDRLYDHYSFRLIPLMGRLIAKDAASYRYLVESIRMHPDQTALAEMMRRAGFERVQYHNLAAGIVAIHRGYKL